MLTMVLVVRHLLPLFHNINVSRGSFGWPLIGETFGFLRPHASTTLGSFLQDRIDRYGAVFTSHLFGEPTVVSCDKELSNFVLQNEERLFQCSYPAAIHGVLGDSSMLAVTGYRHHRLRNLFLSLVASARASPTYYAQVDRAALAVVSSWRGRRTVSFCDEARKFAFSVILKQVVGLSAEEPAAVDILANYLTFMKGLVSLPLRIPGTAYAKAVKARERIACTLERVIQDRRERGSCDESVFLDGLLPSEGFSDKEKVGFVLDALLAGYETTSLLISMLAYFLGQSDKHIDQLKREHQSIRSSKGKDEFLNSEDYKKMEYTQNVINETLRCGNVVKFVHRKALKDVKYKDYFIPSGWKVLPILSAVHLDASLHVNPQQFQPCRWEGLKNQTACSKMLAAFGGGLRLCPGSELSKIEAAFFLHHLLLSYRWSIDGEDVPMAYPYVEFGRGLPIHIDPI
ncbi:hypothetical protein ABZP36_032129 [Zizania latifolia]